MAVSDTFRGERVEKSGLISLWRACLIVMLSLALVILQGSILQTIWPAMIVPNFLIVVIVYLGFFDFRSRTLFLAFLLGLIFDVASQRSIIGPWAGTFVVLFLLTGSLQNRLFVESMVVSALTVLGACLFGTLIYGLMTVWYVPQVYVPYSLVLLEALATAIVSPLIFRLLDLATGRGGNRVAVTFG